MDWISLLGLACFVGFALHRLRARRQHLREAAQSREAAFLASLRGDLVKGGNSPRVAASPASRDDPVGWERTATAGATIEASRKTGAPPAYLSDHQLRVYRLLRDAAPGVDVFARAYLHWLVDGEAGEEALRLDFVCCDHRSKPRVVIDLVRDGDSSAVGGIKRERLAAAGITYLQWDIARLPKRDEIIRLLSDLQRSA